MTGLIGVLRAGRERASLCYKEPHSIARLSFPPSVGLAGALSKELNSCFLLNHHPVLIYCLTFHITTLAALANVIRICQRPGLAHSISQELTGSLELGLLPVFSLTIELIFKIKLSLPHYHKISTRHEEMARAGTAFVPLC